MKYLLSLILTAGILCSCGKSATVTVTNTRNIDRPNETVEVNWSDVLEKLGEQATAEHIVVIGPGEVEIPSQVIYNGGTEPQALIFQASVGPKQTLKYKLVVRDGREPYPDLAYGRFVPERLDDFAWENNVMAFRMYGPALEGTGEISNGIDVWLKNTPNLIIDKWYTPGFNYHIDHGEGLDCYKVGRTLGAGAMAPYENNQLWLGNNFTSYKVLDNGPIRISFELNYAPFLVDSVWVTEKRIISLDANTHFNRITEIYTGDFKRMRVAAGVVLRGGEKGQAIGKVLDILNKPITMVGYWEPKNMDNNMDNGHTGIGLVFPQEIVVETRLKHLLASTAIEEGKPFTYLVGAAWSKADMPTSQEWTQAIFNQSNRFLNPLVVTLK